MHVPIRDSPPPPAHAYVFGYGVQECVGAIRTVRAFAQEDRESARYGAKVEESMRLGIQQAVGTPHPNEFWWRKGAVCVGDMCSQL